MRGTNQPAGLNQPVGQASRLSEHSWTRHLPHFQLSIGHYYFITFVTYNRQLLEFEQKDSVFNAIHFWNGKKYELYAAVILDDHVHMVINPMEPLSNIMHSIKSFTAHQINKGLNKKGKVWQDENFDRVIRDEKDFLEKIKYIANNPIKANVAKNYEDYKWLFVKDWINDKGQTGETPVLPRLSYQGCPTKGRPISKEIKNEDYKFHKTHAKSSKINTRRSEQPCKGFQGYGWQSAFH